MLSRWARFVFRCRRRFLWGGLAAVIVAGALGTPVFGLLDSENDFDDPGSEAVLAREEVARASGSSAAPDVAVLVRLDAPADSRRAQAKLDRVAGELEG